MPRVSLRLRARSRPEGGPPRPAFRGWVASVGGLLLVGFLIGGGGCGSPPPSSPSPSRTPSAPTGGAVPGSSVWSREASRWMGTPYRWGGNDRQGVDCSGFVQQVHLRVSGVRLPRTTSDQFRFGRPVSRRDLRPGDLVFFDTTGRGVSHVGVVLEADADRFAHASVSRGVTVARLSEAYWSGRLLGCRRVP